MLWEVEKSKCENHYKCVARKLRNDEGIPNLFSKFKSENIYSLFGQKTVKILINLGRPGKSLDFEFFTKSELNLFRFKL